MQSAGCIHLVLLFQTGDWSSSIGSCLQSAPSRMWHGLELQNPLNDIETSPAPLSNVDIITPQHYSGQITSHSLLEGIQSLLITVLVFHNSGRLYLSEQQLLPSLAASWAAPPLKDSGLGLPSGGSSRDWTLHFSTISRPGPWSPFFLRPSALLGRALNLFLIQEYLFLNLIP